MYTCVIIEDQPPAQRILQTYIKDYGDLKLIGTHADPLAALDALKQTPADILYLDIHLPKISGLHFLKMLDKKPRVILTTAFPDYALESYELDVEDYLLKPFSFERFVQASRKAVDRLALEISTSQMSSSTQSAEKIFVKSGKEYLQLSLQTIRYISAEGDYTMVHSDQGRHLVSHSLKYWIDLLPSDRFCQVHKSYAVQIDRINKVVGNLIYIEDQQIPIGRTYKESFSNTFLNK